MPVSKGMRFDVFNRDGFTCQYCGQRPPDVILHCDHVIPRSKGGPDELENLITACQACNSGKSAKDINSESELLSEKVESMKARTEQMEAYSAHLDNFLEIRNKELNIIVDHITDWGIDVLVCDAKRFRACLRYNPPHKILDAIDIAFGKFKVGEYGNDYITVKVWKYMYGILKRMKIEAEANA